MASEGELTQVPGPTAHRLALVFGLVAVATLACWPSATTLFTQWTDGQNPSVSHGSLIALICVGLIVRARHDIARSDARASLPGFVALVGCSVAWLIFWRASLSDLHMLLYPALIWLAILAAFGGAIARVLLFPVGFFVFSLPIWGALVGPLQSLTTKAVGVLALVSGLPAYIEGNRVTIASGVFEIAGGCSGLHYFVVGLAVGALNGELGREPLARRALLVAIMGALALVSNWIRVYTVIVAGHLTDMQHYLVRVDHYWFGWGLFALALLLFIWIANRLPAAKRAPGKATPPGYARGAAPLAYGAAAVLVAIGPAIGVAARRGAPPEGSPQPGQSLPAGAGAWSGPNPSTNSLWQPVFVGASHQNLSVYRDVHSRAVEVFSVVYRSQRQGAELVGSNNSLLGTGALSPNGESAVTAAGFRFRETLAVDQDEQGSIIWSAYEIAGRTFVRPIFSQLWYGVRSLASEPQSALLALRAQCTPSCEDARATLTDFVETMGRDLHLTAPRTTDRALK